MNDIDRLEEQILELRKIIVGHQEDLHGLKDISKVCSFKEGSVAYRLAQLERKIDKL